MVNMRLGNCCCCPCEGPPLPPEEGTGNRRVELLLFVDDTASMRNNWADYVNSLVLAIERNTTDKECAWGIVTYGDTEDPAMPAEDLYEVVRLIQTEKTGFAADWNNRLGFAHDGFDAPEAQYYVLDWIANNWSTVGGTSLGVEDVCKGILWLGDNPGHEGDHPCVGPPSPSYPTAASAAASWSALRPKGNCAIPVYGLDFRDSFRSSHGLNNNPANYLDCQYPPGNGNNYTGNFDRATLFAEALGGVGNGIIFQHNNADWGIPEPTDPLSAWDDWVCNTLLPYLLEPCNLCFSSQSRAMQTRGFIERRRGKPVYPKGVKHTPL